MPKDDATLSAASVGSLPLDQIICGDNCEIMRQMPSESIDLVVTSPPYDDLRTYGGHSWDFYGVAWNLKRLLKPGGVIVWNVSDATKNWSETCSSMTQALHFRSIGLNLHDTMIFHRHTMPSVAVMQKRYEQHWEYCFVFSYGPPAVCNHLREEKAYIDLRVGRKRQRRKDGEYASRPGEKPSVKADKIRGNVWRYSVGGGHVGDKFCHEHPAPFPEPLARDHILSWSNHGDVVLDPFSGSGTTAKMARETGRRFIGIEVNPEYVEISRKRLAQQALPMDVA
jgi:site-specific DNA-methyltransferase (adenine-specific)